MNNTLTLTVAANMTANYGESLGNISTIQTIQKDGKTYACRSRESLKNAIMNISHFEDDLKTTAENKVASKYVGKDYTLAESKALEGGYMLTSGGTKTRTSSFQITDAVSIVPFNADYQFHNNLGLATKTAKQKGINVQEKATECGLMPYNYEFSKDMKVYSLTIHLDEIGVDEGFDIEISNEDKCERVLCLLDSIKNLSLLVRGSLDNAEPLFIVGGLVENYRHEFENSVKIKNNKILIFDDFVEKVSNGCHAGIYGETFENELEVKQKLNATSINQFFNTIKEEVKEYYK